LVHSDAETKQFFHLYIGTFLCLTSLISTTRRYAAVVYLPVVNVYLFICPVFY